MKGRWLQRIACGNAVAIWISSRWEISMSFVRLPIRYSNCQGCWPQKFQARLSRMVAYNAQSHRLADRVPSSAESALSESGNVSPLSL
jgi:hypothetical protein